VDSRQLALHGFAPTSPELADTPPPPIETVRAYQRRVQGASTADARDERQLRFDASGPLEVIRAPTPEVTRLTVAEHDVIDERVTYRLAQRPKAYVILKYIRPVIKRIAPPLCRSRSIRIALLHSPKQGLGDG
jgi:hypothetical protein